MGSCKFQTSKPLYLCVYTSILSGCSNQKISVFKSTSSTHLSFLVLIQNAWIHEAYVTISNCVTHAPVNVQQLSGCPNIVTRAEWGARAPTQDAGHLPATPKYMFLHHGASTPCFTKEKCIDKVQGYQNWHMDGHGITIYYYSLAFKTTQN